MLTRRQKKILSLLKHNKKLNVKDLSPHIEGSEATLRRELNKLATLGYLELSYGSITFLKDETSEMSSEEHIPQTIKNILSATVSTIHEGNVILLPGNRYNREIAHLLVKRKAFITIVTNSMEIFDIVKEERSINTIVLGGSYNKEQKFFYGNATLSYLSTIRADSFITGPTGIDFELGFLENPMQDFHVLSEMVNVARKNIVYLTSDIIEKESGIFFAHLSDIKTIILPQSLYDKYQSQFIPFDFDYIIVQDQEHEEKLQ